jgi:phosphoglycerol transferase MdoB-like AlkP superfamily enzyme
MGNAPHPASRPGTLYRLARSRFQLVALSIGLFVSASLLTRVVLLLVDRALLSSAPLELGRALGVGLMYDVLTACWLAVPLVVWLTLVPERWLARRGHQRLLFAGYALATAFAVFVAAAEYFFFDEFTGRFNFVAVDYLVYPTEVVTNVWESYHIVWALLAVAAVATAIVMALRAPLRRAVAAHSTPPQRLGVALGFGAVLGALSIAVTPAMARVSENRELNEVAANGYYSFFQALVGADAPYDGWYATMSPSSAMARLHRLIDDAQVVPGSVDSATTRRLVDAGPGLAPGEPPLNVVVVLEESLGSRFVGALNDSGGITPRFDSLAAEGTLLTNAYSTGNRTIRALEATTNGLPPLPGVATVRRDASRGLFTLPGVLRSRGYQTLFVYGGRALFDNMGDYMRANGVDRVIEQRDFPDTSFTTAWGVSDEAIFHRALAEMDGMHATGRPFYTLVLSVSNHKPYTYPTGRIAQDPAAHKRANAVRYADWALGGFMREARAHPWFGRTIFVLMGDHGARVYGAQEIPLPSYEVPILLYAPGRIPARRVGTVASSLDVPPTILGLLGGRYESRFMGHDVLAADSAAGRAFMTHNAEIALMRGDRLAVLGLRQSARLWRVTPDGHRQSQDIAVDSAGRALLADAIAVYSQADRLYRAGEYRMR